MNVRIAVPIKVVNPTFYVTDMPMESDASQYQNFDPNFAAELLVDIAQERSVESMLEKFLRVALARPTNARVEIWLIKKGIARSSEKSNASDQTSRLGLVASGNNP